MDGSGTTSGMSSATPTSCWPIDLYPMGLLARRGLGDRTSYQTGDGRDPVGWEDSFDVQLGLPTRAAGGRPTGVCPTRQQPQPLQPSDSKLIRDRQLLGGMVTGLIPVAAFGGVG